MKDKDKKEYKPSIVDHLKVMNVIGAVSETVDKVLDATETRMKMQRQKEVNKINRLKLRMPKANR